MCRSGMSVLRRTRPCGLHVQQPCERTDREPPVARGGNDCGNGWGGFPAGPPACVVAVMQQNDRAAREASDDVGGDLLAATTAPVVAGDTPLHGSETELAG